MNDIINILNAVIPVGKDNAIHLNVLADKIGVTPATVKKYVQGARRKGLDICSGKDGYWFAENDADRKDFETLLRRQALSRLKTTKPMRDKLKEYKGQITFANIESERGIKTNE